MKHVGWIIIIGLLGGTAGAAERVFTWTDADGTVHFSDKPIDRQATPMLVKPIPPNKQNLERRQQAEKEAAAKESANQAGAADQTAQAPDPEMRAKNCEKSRKLLDVLERSHGRRLYEDLPDGTRHFLSDEERATRTQKTREAVAEWCD